MLRLSIAILIACVIEGDCWKTIIVNTKRDYSIKNEGKSFKPLYLENEESINSDLVIDGNAANVIKMGYSSPFPMNDTVKIEIFDNEASYAHSFNIIILKDRYVIRYSREIIDTEFIQKFEPVKSKLELSSLDFSNGSKIRGHVEYTGRCVSGCLDKNKKIKIEGNFAVKINRY